MNGLWLKCEVCGTVFKAFDLPLPMREFAKKAKLVKCACGAVGDKLSLAKDADIPKRCQMCKRVLDNPLDPTTKDCGGDCLKCVAECFDEDAMAELAALKTKEVLK